MVLFKTSAALAQSAGGYTDLLTLWYPCKLWKKTEMRQWQELKEKEEVVKIKFNSWLFSGCPGGSFLTAIEKREDPLHAQREQALHASLFQRFLCLKKNIGPVHAREC